MRQILHHKKTLKIYQNHKRGVVHDQQMNFPIVPIIFLIDRYPPLTLSTLMVISSFHMLLRLTESAV